MDIEKKNIYMPEITSDTVYRKDLELDGSLPEDAPDVARLIRVDAHTSAPETVFENGKLCVKCDVVFGILYESDLHSRPAYTQTSAVFTQTTDISAPNGEHYIRAFVRCAGLGCKLLGARRFVIRAGMETYVNVISVREYAVSDAENAPEGTFFRTAECSYAFPCRTLTAERGFSGEASAEASAAGVLFTDSYCLPPEETAEDGKLTVRTGVTLKAFCESEDGGFFTVPYVFEAELTAEDPGISAGDAFYADVCVSSCSAAAESDEYGENRVIRFNCKLSMTAVEYEPTTELLPDDVFCSDFVCETRTGELEYHERIGKVRRDMAFEKEYDTERTDIRGVTDMTLSFSVDSTEYADGVLNVKGSYSAEFIADTDSGVTGGGFNGEYAESIPFAGGDTAVCVKVVPVSASYTVADGEIIRLRGSAALCAEVFADRKKTALVSAAAAEGALPAMTGMKFYFPDNAETAWDIAKRYRTDPAKLYENNPAAFTAEGAITPDTAFVIIK